MNRRQYLETSGYVKIVFAKRSRLSAAGISGSRGRPVTELYFLEKQC